VSDEFSWMGIGPKTSSRLIFGKKNLTLIVRDIFFDNGCFIT
jgi:hypothetical protein